MSKDASVIAEFWAWFREHDTELKAVQDSDHPLWDTALSRLQRINGGLRFEMSGLMTGQREWICTAEGDRALFPLVETVVASAAALNGWTFVALKPPMGFDFAINYEGIVFDPKAMWFLPLESANRPSELGLRIGITGLTDHIQRAAANAALIILDTALGERAAASDVQHVEIEVLPSDPARAGYIELHQLAEFIAWRKRRVVPA